jgi:hypothetical protein
VKNKITKISSGEQEASSELLHGIIQDVQFPTENMKYAKKYDPYGRRRAGKRNCL